MRKIWIIVVCACLVTALCLPGVASAKEAGAITKVTNKVYTRSVNVVQNTELHCTEILRNAFALFNPCLDLVKGCAAVAFYPIEKPMSLLEKRAAKPRRVAKKKAAPKVEAPKKPEASGSAK